MVLENWVQLVIESWVTNWRSDARVLQTGAAGWREGRVAVVTVVANRQAIEEYPPTQAFHRARREAQDVAGEVYVVRPELDHCASPEAAGGILLFSNAADGPGVPRS